MGSVTERAAFINIITNFTESMSNMAYEPP
jgi:hypothetical protein